jgi:hypothetical protein
MKKQVMTEMAASVGLSCIVIALVVWSNTFAYSPGTDAWNVGGTISFFAGAIAGGFLVFCAAAPTTPG